LISKYGILIKKKLQEKYPEKYNELEEQEKLIPIIRDYQYDIEQYRKKLINNNNTLLTKCKMVEILDKINNEIDIIVEKIGSDKIGCKT